MSTERDTHFMGFAKLLYEDLRVKFDDLVKEEGEGNLYGPRPQELDRIEQDIQTYIAQRAYDLVKPSPTDIPDLAAWPENEVTP